MMNSHIKSSILIIEDVNADIDILNHILKKHYTLYIAKSGEAALKMAVEQKPDLILLDIILPDMTGFAVLEKLKESNETRGIPVIIITAINNAQYEEKGLSHGAVDYITKPFHNTVVLARIKIHMQILHYIRTIEQLGLIDSLTGVANRRGFTSRTGMEWDRAAENRKPLGLLLIDVDSFKAFNDAFGRPQGDLMLQETAMAVGGILKRPADLLARWEDDAFAVLLPSTEPHGAISLAEEIRKEIESLDVRHLEHSQKTPITVSIGVASTVPSEGQTFGDLIAAAERLLNEAKQSGKNKVCFDRK